MDHLPLLSCISMDDAGRLKAFLRDQRFRLVELDGSSVDDAESFFKKVKSLLPLDPPISGAVNWDALSDSLWGGLDELREARVALLWLHAEKMLHHGLCDLLSAVDCLQSVARSFNDNAGSNRIELLIFLLGTGPNFSPFDH